MRAEDTEQLLKQLDSVLEEWRLLFERAGPWNLSLEPSPDIVRLLTRARAAIERASPPGSPYTKQATLILSRSDVPEWDSLQKLVGVAQSLRQDIEAGYLKTMSELIHGELFADFLEMAEHLLDSGYKDAAAVIAGSTLEGHLRQMCVKVDVPTTFASKDGPRPKKADKMNADLAGAQAYSKLDQKNVTAWLDIRNNAAHGHYSKYTAEQVTLMIAGIRDFVTRNPA